MEVLSAASPPSGTGGGDGDDRGDGGGNGDWSSASNPTQKKKKQDEPELTSAEFRSPVQGLAFIKCTVKVCERMNEFTRCAESLNV